jgi:hypothetical protein
MIKLIGEYEVDIDPLDEYFLFNVECTGQDIIEHDLGYLNPIDCMILNKHISRINNIPYRFHPDIVTSLELDKENSPYYKKTPHEIEIIHRKESTRDVTKDKERKQMMNPINETDQSIRNKKYYTINKLVQMGYDRTFAMDKLAEYIDVNTNSVLNLVPTRIAQILDEYIEKENK